MKILQIISSAGFYGAEKMLLELASGLKDRGHAVTVAGLVSKRGNGADIIAKAREKAIDAAAIPCRGVLDRRALVHLRRLILEKGAELVHSHGYKSDIYAFLARPSRGQGLVATCHNWLGESLKMRSYRWIDTALIRRFDRVVAVSEVLREQTARVVPVGRLVMIRNGVSLDAPERSNGGGARVREELSLDKSDRVLVAVGRLSREKGFEHFINAVADLVPEHPRLRALIAGEGPERAPLTALIRRRGLERYVRLLGRRDDVMDILAAGEIFVMPSLKEGMPMALLEAMLARKPVVASRVGDIPRVIDVGETGLLVEPGNAGLLGHAMDEILRNPRKGRRFGLKGHEKVRREFSAEKMTDDYLKLYREVAEELGEKAPGEGEG